MSEDTVIYQGITRQQTKCYISPFSLPPGPLLIVILNKQNLLFRRYFNPWEILLGWIQLNWVFLGPRSSLLKSIQEYLALK